MTQSVELFFTLSRFLTIDSIEFPVARYALIATRGAPAKAASTSSPIFMDRAPFLGVGVAH